MNLKMSHLYDAQRAYTREEEYCMGQRVETNDILVFKNINSENEKNNFINEINIYDF